MSKPTTLGKLLQEHFDGVLGTIERGSWGHWILDQDLVNEGRFVLRHEGSSYSLAIDGTTDWVAIIAGKEWATAADVGELIFAMRDLEYARWLGVLPRQTPTTTLAAAVAD